MAVAIPAMVRICLPAAFVMSSAVSSSVLVFISCPPISAMAFFRFVVSVFIGSPWFLSVDDVVDVVRDVVEFVSGEA